MNGRPRLVGVAGPLTGVVVPLSDAKLTVGRSRKNDLVIPDSAVSREHCLIEHDGDRYRLTDLASRHGTSVNQMMVDARSLLHGDRIGIGESAFLFLVSEERAAGVSATLTMEDDTMAPRTMEVRLEDALYLHPERMLADGADPLPVSRSLDALVRISSAINTVPALEPLVSRLIELIFDSIPAERAGIVLLSAEAQENHDLMAGSAFGLTFAMARGDAPHRSVTVSRTIARQVIREKVAILSNSVQATSGWAKAESLAAAQVKSVLCVPLALFDRVIGVLYLDASDSSARFDEEHLQLATAIAGISAMPLALARTSASLDEAPTAKVVVGPLLVGPEPDTDRARPKAAPGAPRATVVLRPGEPAHLGSALALRSVFERLPASLSRCVLVMDYGTGGELRGGSGLPASCLDRLAALPDLAGTSVVLASHVPSLARLASLVACSMSTKEARSSDARAWYREILLATGLVVTCATHASIEAQPAEEGSVTDGAAVGAPNATGTPDEAVRLARLLAARLQEVGARLSQLPSGLRPLLSLDGRGVMGASQKGTIYLSDSADVVAKKLRSARTDSRPAFDPSEDIVPELRNLILLMHAVTGERVTTLVERWTGKGHGAIKGELAEAVNDFLEPIRRRRAELEASTTLAATLTVDATMLEAVARDIAEKLSQTPERMR